MIRVRTLVALLTVVAVSLACRLAPFGTNPMPGAATLDELYTAAALTVQAAVSPVVSATPPSAATNAFPTFAATGPSRTAAPPLLCDAASFVADVTVPDGTLIDAGADFTKTWRIQNMGTCSWTPSYSLVFSGGDRLNGPASANLSGNVNPGQTVDLSVRMTAPDSIGQYQGLWKLRNSAGLLFGIGPQAQGPFWVKIRVAGPSYVAYDFATGYCNAAWQNNNRDLACPGSEGDGKGYVIRLNHPVLESGKTEDEASLLMVPKAVDGGLIFGTYPAFHVREGDRFRARVACQYRAYACNVLLRLDYRIGGGDPHRLGSWNEAYEGKFYPIDLDLSQLAGKDVTFMLVVMANGSPNQDEALWVAPRIIRGGTPPPTQTFTPVSTRTSTPAPAYTPTSSLTSTSTATATSTATPTSSPTPTSTATSTP